MTLTEKPSGEGGTGMSMALLLAGLPVPTEESAKDRLSAVLELFLLCQASAIWSRIHGIIKFIWNVQSSLQSRSCYICHVIKTAASHISLINDIFFK